MLKYFLIGILMCSLVSCGSYKEPDFKGIENIRMQKFGFNNSNLTLDLHYYNPNKKSFKLKNASGEAWVEGAHLGHFVIDTSVSIPARADFTLPVKLQVDMGKTLKNSFGALFKKDVKVKLEGKAKIIKGPLQFNIPIKYEGKHALDELWRDR